MELVRQQLPEIPPESKDRNETVISVGVRDMVVVRAGQKTLIAHKNWLEDVKKIVEAVNGSNEKTVETDPTLPSPWTQGS